MIIYGILVQLSLLLAGVSCAAITTQEDKHAVRSMQMFDDESKIRRNMTIFNPMQNPDINFATFAAFTILPIPPTFRRKLESLKHRFFESSRWTALLDQNAFPDFNSFLRASVVHTLSMRSVLAPDSKDPDFSTSFDAKVFTKQWAPEHSNWTIFRKYQTGDRNGAVLFYNKESDTLALIFRPLVDMESRQRMANGYENKLGNIEAAEFTAYNETSKTWSTLAMNGKPIKTLPFVLEFYHTLEKELLTSLASLAMRNELPGSKLVMGGISLGGFLSQMFSVRCALMEPEFMRIQNFNRKHAFSFNSPPVFSRDDKVMSQVMDSFKTQKWEFTRMVSQDPNSIIWFGDKQLYEQTKFYAHLGPATHLTFDSMRFQDFPDRKKSVAIVSEADGYPVDLFPRTPYATIDDIPVATEAPLKHFWMGMKMHVMGLGMPFTFFADAVRRKLQISDHECNVRLWNDAI